MEQRPQHRTTHVASRVSTLGTTSQHLHLEQLPRALIREDLSLRELPLQLPLQHRALRRDCSGRRQEHPDAEAYVSGINIRNFVASGLAETSLANKHILALPLHYSQHPSTTSTGAYRCRQITRVPREEQHDIKFLESIYWPQLSDDIDFNIKEHFNNLQKQNIATQDLQLQATTRGGH